MPAGGQSYSGNPIADFINGLSGGFGRGAQHSEDRIEAARRRKLEEAQLARQSRGDQLNEALIGEQHGIRYVEPGTEQRTASPEAMRLRTGVADGLTRSKVGLQSAAPPMQGLEMPDLRGPAFTTSTHPGGFEKVAPNAIERQQAQAEKLRRGVGASLMGVLGVGSPDEALALHDAGLADDVFARNNPAPAPAITPFQQAQIDLDRQRLTETRRSNQAGEEIAGLRASNVTPKAPTEAQGRMRIAYSRAVPALAQIEAFIEKNKDVPETSFFDKVTPGRYFQPADVQAYNQAAEAVASALLRIESGAAISQQELESYKKQFIPQPGDKPEVIAQKLQTVRQTLEAIRQTAGIEEAAPPSTPAEGSGFHTARTPAGQRLQQLLGLGGS